VLIAYADPPYPGMSRIYKDHPDYAGEVDHHELVARLERDYGAWVLHTASTTLEEVLGACRWAGARVRVGAWCKTFCAFRKGTGVAYAWEPVILRPTGRGRRREQPTSLDWIACPAPLGDGLAGAKPEAVVHWALRALDADPGEDEVDDLFPGSGNVGRAVGSWRRQPALPDWTLPLGVDPLEGVG
jgi:hypothetical protein